MDLNLVVLCGRLATPPEVRTFDSGAVVVRLLVTVRSESPRRRVDVVPVTYWAESSAPERVEELAALPAGSRVWVCGSVQRRFWDHADGRRSRLEVVAEKVDTRELEVAR